MVGLQKKHVLNRMPASSFFDPRQFAQKFAKNVTPNELTGSTFPIRKTPDLFTTPEGKIEAIFPKGPASSLPVTDFNELYPDKVPVESSYEEPRLTPFGREFDFTQPSKNIYDAETVNERSKRFLNQYFPGEDPGQVINPATGRAYGNELKIHDAMHDFANVGNTLRGEELITIAENIGATPLAAKNIGLNNLTQQLDNIFEEDPNYLYDQAERDAFLNARTGGRTLVQQRGATRGSSLFRDANNVGSFLSPPISKEEFNTMAKRGQEFYDQVHQNWNQFKRGGSVEWSDEPTRKGFETRKNVVDEFLGNDLENTYAPPRAITQRIAGGYNKGGIPYGNPLSLMNAPLAPTVDTGLWSSELEKTIESGALNLQNELEKEEQIYKSPEQIAARDALEKWKNRANAIRSLAGEDAATQAGLGQKYIEKGLDINSPEFQKDLHVYQSSAQANPRAAGWELMQNTIGPEPNAPLMSHKFLPVSRSVNELTQTYSRPQESDFFDNIKKPENTKTAVSAAIQNVLRNEPGDSGITASAPINYRKGGRVYLNPANLGANVPLSGGYAETTLKAAGINSSDALLEIAAKAKQIEGYNKALPAVKRAIKTGFNTATDITGAVPLFDPEFRRAVKQGNAREVAKRVATEYATGVVAAPVVGMGLGTLNRIAPRAALAATGALNLARTANPVAVVSQLGGSSKMTPQQEAYENQLRETKLKQAEAARKRGGKWQFPTPFGQMTIPDLGITETGGLYIR